MKTIKTFKLFIESNINEGCDCGKDYCQNCGMKEGQKYARKCDHCGGGMNSGYVINDGDCYACSEECLYVDGYTKEQFDQDYENDNAYWTDWEEQEDYQYIVKDGKLEDFDPHLQIRED